MRNTVQVKYEVSGPRKLAGTITVSSSLAKSGLAEIVREFIKKQHKVEINEGLTVAVINEAA